MELKHVKGNTFVIEASGLIPCYRLNAREIILLDSGYEVPDREGLQALLDREKLHVAAVIGTHVHMDHSGNHRYFRSKGATIALPLVEASVASSPLAAKLAFFVCSPGQMETIFGSMLTETDRVILPHETEITMCGSVFRIVPLPGHTAGHVGIITPDNVFYLGDALMGEEVLESAKLPTSLSYALDLSSKETLRQFSCDAYIVAHKGIYHDISELIEKNIAHREEKIQTILSLLTKPMTFDEFSNVIWQALSMRTKRPERIAMYLRNLHCIVEYLCDQGKVERQFEAGMIRYAQCGTSVTDV